MGNDKNVGVKKEKGIRKLKDRISFWKAKLQADEEERYSPKLKPKLKIYNLNLYINQLYMD